GGPSVEWTIRPLSNSDAKAWIPGQGRRDPRETASRNGFSRPAQSATHHAAPEFQAISRTAVGYRGSCPEGALLLSGPESGGKAVSSRQRHQVHRSRHRDVHQESGVDTPGLHGEGPEHHSG